MQAALLMDDDRITGLVHTAVEQAMAVKKGPATWQTEPEQTEPEQTEPEQTEPEQTEPEQTVAHCNMQAKKGRKKSK